jgi:hypothetical protein
MNRDQRKAMFAQRGSGKGFDGLGRKIGFRKAKIGDIARVSQGTGIDSNKIVKVTGHSDFSNSFEVKVIKPEIQKGITLVVLKDRLERK